MTKLWTSQEIAAATGEIASADFAVSGVAFDSREIGEGDLFFAMRGEQADGHRFVDQAFSQGAAGAVVSSPVTHPRIQVPDTQKALDDLGRASRARSQAKIIGVTGSAGKTGTKEALFAALDRSPAKSAHRSVKSYNNHVGVPLSLSRMPRDADYGVFEMGMNHPGELRALTQLVRPHVAIVTTIAPAHIGFFKDESEIAQAKAEIFEGLEPGGVALVPADSPHCETLATAAARHAGLVLRFGFAKDADIRLLEQVPDSDGGNQLLVQLQGGTVSYTLSQPGDHWVANSLAVMGAVEAVGSDVALAGLALADMDGLKGRGARHIIPRDRGNVLLIDESYNANPASMAATIALLGRENAQRRIAVLGAMKELGEKTEYYHAEIARFLRDARIDHAILIGDEMQITGEKLAQGVEQGPSFDHCATAGEALSALSGMINAGDAVLVKGSNSVGLSAIVEAFAQREE